MGTQSLHQAKVGTQLPQQPVGQMRAMLPLQVLAALAPLAQVIQVLQALLSRQPLQHHQQISLLVVLQTHHLRKIQFQLLLTQLQKLRHILTDTTLVTQLVRSRMTY